MDYVKHSSFNFGVCFIIEKVWKMFGFHMGNCSDLNEDRKLGELRERIRHVSRNLFELKS